MREVNYGVKLRDLAHNWAIISVFVSCFFIKRIFFQACTVKIRVQQQI